MIGPMSGAKLPRKVSVRAVVNPIRSGRTFCTSSICNQPRRLLIPMTAPSRFGSYDMILPSSVTSLKSRSSKRPEIPSHIPKPEYWKSGTPEILTHPTIKTRDQINSMKTACRLAARILEYGGSLVKVGVATEEIDLKSTMLLSRWNLSVPMINWYRIESSSWSHCCSWCIPFSIELSGLSQINMYECKQCCGPWVSSF